MKKFLVSTALAAAVALTASTAVSPAALVDEAPPLRVKIVSPDGKPKLKVKRKLEALISCSKTCRASATTTFILPVGKDSGTIKGVLEPGMIGRIPYRLTGYGLAQLKLNYRISKYRVKVVAKDVETGKTVSKTRTFGFYRK